MARSLTTIARELNSACAHRWGLPVEKLPPLLFMTDEKRTPDPAEGLAQLPQGTGIVFRHYQDPERHTKAKITAQKAASLGMPLLVAEDLALARAIGATGLHLPERAIARAQDVRSAWPEALITAAVHSRNALMALPDSVDAALLSPIFPTKSHKDATALGLDAAREWAAEAPCPTYALGGINKDNAQNFIGTPFCGFAGISIFTET